MYPQRKSLRLNSYDYTSAGAYFLTICTQERVCLFGQVVNGQMALNDAGQIVADEWLQTQVVRPNVELDTFVVMPNHVHGVIVITQDGVQMGMARHAPTERLFAKPIPGSLSTIVGAFKSAVTKRIHRLSNSPAYAIWQRGFHEHIIRDESDLARIREYVACNVARWKEDRFFSD